MKKSQMKLHLIAMIMVFANVCGLNIYAMKATSADNPAITSKKIISTTTQIANSTLKKAWTFDCNSQGWGEFSHSNSFVSTYMLADEHVNSGYLELKHKEGAPASWLFGPVKEMINADLYKFVHFSLSLENAGTLPAEGVPALFVWDLTGNMTPLKTKAFTIQAGQNDYTIDLSTTADWKGNVYINRIHLPNSNITATGYTPATAVYRLDWVMMTDKSDYTKPVQDTTKTCIPIKPILSDTMESVVFGNRASMKVFFTGSRSEVKLKMWTNMGDTIIKMQTVFTDGNIYFSNYDLALNTTYNFQIEVENSLGIAKSSIQQFTTGTKTAEEAPMNYWMTPSPFKLTQNPNDNLLDNETWQQAAEFAQVFKIHGATFYNTADFYAYNLPKLFYALNKFKMRLAFEAIFSGNKTGQQFATEIENYIEKFAKLGGKLEFLTWDGMLMRSYITPESGSIFRTKEEGIEAEAECTRILNEKYPYFHIIPLPNLPNWDVKDATGKIISHNAGNWTSTANVQSINDLFDIYLAKLKQKNTKIKFIEIDHPYSYYDNGRTVSAQRVKAMADYCLANGLKLINIINTTTDEPSYSFKKGCLDYYDALVKDGNKPEFIDVESWYRFPQYLIPETKDNSFTNTIRDLGLKFFLVGDVMVSSQGDLNSIRGYGVTLQLFAKLKSSGLFINANWTVDRTDLASIDANGLLTTIKWGKVVVTATAKDGSQKYGTFELTIIDPNQPTALKIRTQGNVIAINGIGSTLQFYAEDAITSKASDVDWSIDNFRAASIDANGLVTSIRTGVVNVKASLKQDALLFATTEITITNSTGLSNESFEEQISVYPNPANDYLYFELPKNNNESTVSLLNVLGGTIKSISGLKQSSFKIFVGDLTKGCFFVQVKSDGRIATKKIILK